MTAVVPRGASLRQRLILRLLTGAAVMALALYLAVRTTADRAADV